MRGRGQTAGRASVPYSQWQLQKTWGCRGRFPAAQIYFHALTSFPRSSSWPWTALFPLTCATVGHSGSLSTSTEALTHPKGFSTRLEMPLVSSLSKSGVLSASRENSKTLRAFNGSTIGPNSRIWAPFCTVTEIVTSALPLCCLS